MFSRSPNLAALFTIATAVGCASPPEETKDGDLPGSVQPSPNAMPCNVDTGYPGDEYCILPPEPGTGFQLHYGPKNYDDPAEVERYLLHPGEELTDCVFMKTGNDSEVFFNGYHGRMRPGSHHMLLYVQDTHVPDSEMPGGCNQGIDTRNIFGAQTPTIDVEQLASGALENEGLAVRLAPRQQGVIQLHFINTGDEPILREAWANIVYADPGDVKVLGDPIFFLGGLAMNVPPGATQIVKGTAVAPASVRLIMATGHFHANTQRFTAHKTIGGNRELLMEDYDWHEPTLLQFDSATQNSPPDATSRRAGGYSGVVELEPGDTIEWECEVVNKAGVPLGFGNQVYTAEMCNVFGLYAPSIGGAWRAVNP